MKRTQLELFSVENTKCSRWLMTITIIITAIVIAIII